MTRAVSELGTCDGNVLYGSPSERLLRFSRGHLEQPINLPGSLDDMVEETPRVLNDFFHVRSVEDSVAAEDLFRLGERAVGDHDLAVGTLVHADARGPSMHALTF